MDLALKIVVSSIYGIKSLSAVFWCLAKFKEPSSFHPYRQDIEPHKTRAQKSDVGQRFLWISGSNPTWVEQLQVTQSTASGWRIDLPQKTA